MKLEVGDRVKFIDITGISLANIPPLGTQATITHSYSVDGTDYIDVKWDSLNGPRWISYGYLAERFQKLYPTPSGGYSEEQPYEPMDPKNWGLGFTG